MNTRWDSSKVRDIHTRLLLSAIREKTSTRTELARATGLSLPTVGAIVKILIEEGYIVNEKLGEYGGGRKPMLLRFVPDARYIIGVNLGGAKTQAVLADLNGSFVSEIVSGSSTDLEKNVSGSVISLIEQLQKWGFSWERVAGIGVSVRGCFDIPNRYYFFPGEQEGHRLQDDLEDHFQVPVVLERNANAAVLSEWVGRQATGVRNLAFVNVGKGVSSGIITDAQLCRGFLGNAGEFGHVVVENAGKICPDCGQRGCLETVVSTVGLVEAARENGVLVLDDGDVSVGFLHLVSLARSGDPKALQCFEYAVQTLGQALVSLINIMNPELVVLGGEVVWCYPELMDALTEFVLSRCWPYSRQGLRLEMAPEDKHVFLHGAVTLIRDSLFVPHNNRLAGSSNVNIGIAGRG
ncbi:MAG: ROK family transcriptional regulator [Bacillota bacterium]|jgi:N-acetylglucosamine repressor|nr:ROK family transcriptional regulator [Bacillota bacterium]